MADRRFYTYAGPFAVGDLLRDGPAHSTPEEPDFIVRDVAPLTQAGPQDISFVTANKRYADDARNTRAGVIIAPPAAVQWVEGGPQLVICEQPQLLFNFVVGRFYPDCVDLNVQQHFEGGLVHPTAKIHETAEVSSTAVIGPDVEIGAGSQIGHHCVIGRGVQIGRHCRINAQTTIEYSLLGDRVHLASGVRLGTHGFGLIEGEQHLRVYHIGRVIVQNDVDIGANTTIDRGTYDDTVIGEGTKIDNLVQIAHNVRIGRHVRIAGTCGFAGSSVVHDHAVLGGGVGVGNGAEIGRHAIVAGRSVVLGLVADNGFYAGHPARPIKEWQKQKAFINRLFRKSEKQKGGRDG